MTAFGAPGRKGSLVGFVSTAKLFLMATDISSVGRWRDQPVKQMPIPLGAALWTSRRTS